MLLNISVIHSKISRKVNSVEERLNFTKFEDLFVWLDEFKEASKNGTGVLIYGLGKDGRTGLSGRRDDVDIKFDSKNYFRAREIAIESGLLKGVAGGDKYVRTREAGLIFARAMDAQFLVASS